MEDNTQVISLDSDEEDLKHETPAVCSTDERLEKVAKLESKPLQAHARVVTPSATEWKRRPILGVWEYFTKGPKKNSSQSWAYCNRCLSAGLSEESCGIAGTRPEMESHLCKCKHSSAEEKLSILNNFACAQPLQLKTPRLQPQPQANPLPPVSHQLQEEPATPSPQTSPRLSPEKQQFLRALFLQGRLQTAQATNPMPAQPPILQPAQPPTGPSPSSSGGVVPLDPSSQPAHNTNGSGGMHQVSIASQNTNRNLSLPPDVIQGQCTARILGESPGVQKQGPVQQNPTPPELGRQNTVVSRDPRLAARNLAVLPPAKSRASEELLRLLYGIKVTYLQYAEKLHDASFYDSTELAAADRRDLMQIGIPIGPAGAIIQAARSAAANQAGVRQGNLQRSGL